MRRLDYQLRIDFWDKVPFLVSEGKRICFHRHYKILQRINSYQIGVIHCRALKIWILCHRMSRTSHFLHCLRQTIQKVHCLQTQRGSENAFQTVHEITLKKISISLYFACRLKFIPIIARRDLITSTSLVGNERWLTNVNTSNHLLSSNGTNTFPSRQTFQSSISPQKQSNFSSTKGTTHGIDSLIGKRGVCFVDSAIYWSLFN